jgi:hypothetical protein
MVLPSIATISPPFSENMVSSLVHEIKHFSNCLGLTVFNTLRMVDIDGIPFSKAVKKQIVSSQNSQKTAQ